MTGFVTPRIVKLAIDLGAAVLAEPMSVERNATVGVSAALKNSGESRWSLRCGIAVLMDSTWAVPVRTPSSSLASTCSNWPRNVEMPLCLMAKPTLLWTGSSLYVPAGTG